MLFNNKITREELSSKLLEFLTNASSIKILDPSSKYNNQSLDKIVDNLSKAIEEAGSGGNNPGHILDPTSKDITLIDAVKTADDAASNSFSAKLTCGAEAKKFYEIVIPCGDILFGRYSLIIRLKTNNKDKAEAVFNVKLGTESAVKKTTAIKGTDFSTTTEYDMFYDNFEFNKTTYDDRKLKITVEGIGDGVVLDLDYIQISPIQPAVYLP